MTFGPASTFRYSGYEVDPAAGTVACHYDLDGEEFVERFSASAGDPAWAQPAADEAARLLSLLAGVSYYKAGAPPVVDLGDTPVRDGEAAFLRRFYIRGLGEFAYRHGLDLRDLRVVGGRPAGPRVRYGIAGGQRPLVPFGGGIDSIVTVESVRPLADPTLFVMSREGDRFAAIEAAAAVSGLPVARAGRVLDPKILESSSRGYLNGHVPVTAVVSAAALLVAVLGGHDAVVMSNEWSASFGTTVEDGREVNHQYSKGSEFEDALRAVLAGSYEHPPEYFSLLRSSSELSVAHRFASLDRYHAAFRSCNRAFHVDPAARLDHWCGRCDKCCFIDLILAPFLPQPTLAAVFGGAEPLEDTSLLPQFEALLGRSSGKPFECVGDAEECRAAAALAAARPDRVGSPVLASLAEPAAAGAADLLLRPLGPTNVPRRYAPANLVV